MGKLHYYVSLLTTLTPGCLTSSFVVQKGARRMTAILQVTAIKTYPVPHTSDLAWSPRQYCLFKDSCRFVFIVEQFKQSWKTFDKACLVPKQGQSYFQGLEWFYQVELVALIWKQLCKYYSLKETHSEFQPGDETWNEFVEGKKKSLTKREERDDLSYMAWISLIIMSEVTGR